MLKLVLKSKLTPLRYASANGVRLSYSLVLVLCLALASCDGRSQSSSLPKLTSAELSPPILLGASLDFDRSVSGLPHGIRVSWARVNDPTAVSYYLYRDIQPIAGNPPANVALRVNGGAPIPQTPDDPVTFDDSEFPGGYPVVGQTYHYRLTVVNDTGDESDFSNEITYTVTGHSVTGFTPASGAYGDQIMIDCEQIYDFDDTIDFVKFPSREGLLDAEIVSWDGATESITVTVPDFAITGQLRVIVNGLASLSQDNFVITSPYVLDINKEHVAEGDQVAILGANLGATQGASAVAFTGQEASPTLLWSNTLIAATVPPIDPLAVDTVVGVTVGGNLLGEFDLGLDPMITSPSSLTLTLSETATLNGRHFDTTGTLTVNGANVLTASWLKTKITAIVDNNWTEGDVVVATQWDSNAIPFTLDGAIFVGFPAGFDGTLVESGGSIPLAALTNSNTERVEYYVDGALYFTDSNGADGFDVEFIADDFTNERHTVTMRAYRRSRSMISAEAYFFSRVFDGDYNGDDVIDEVDLDALGAYLVELSIAGDYTAAQYPTRDGNRDGFIDEMDIAVIGYKYGETR